MSVGVAYSATYIDFATPAGSTGAVGGNAWNTISNTTSNSLVNIAGAANGSLTVTFTDANVGVGYGGGAFNNTDSGSSAPGFLLDGGSPIASAIGDGIYVNDGFGGSYATFSFTGLQSSTQYEFTVYGGRSNEFFTTDGLIQSADGTTQLASYGNRESASFNVTTDSSGALSFRFTEDESAKDTSSNATLVAMSFVIPEPSSAALLGLGGLALILRRRK